MNCTDVSTFQIDQEKKEILLTYKSGKEERFHFDTVEKIKEQVEELFKNSATLLLSSSFRFKPLDGGVEMQFGNSEDCWVFQEFAAPVLFQSLPTSSEGTTVKWEGKDLIKCFIHCVSSVIKRQWEQLPKKHWIPPSRLRLGWKRSS